MATTDSKDSESRERLDVPTAMRRAAGQLGELLQCEPSSVSALKAVDDGWSADIEVVELEKVPDTASVMATYRVSLDLQGQLVGYERIRRYAKGQIDR
ncbi:gas vesicle protein [Streptomyces sp. NPDC090052]|uniref:gas vesicle protein GvpO n=1 Tax=unclassified Streptomyces TaxID=2593676 RepID=UPI00224F2CB8|nr:MULTISPECIES: gas vesicle protein [unclassified Streptomyces]WSS48955.1 gas vesicle protein [Streptomyces sp. NBC_01180]WSV03958.1 gas vesicle protein [Streptomyces sp. NBC_01020]WSX42003.1 gas vesicle protein [Streptomyces sp. NBC_00963]WSX69946.1 gas vesicle protein [Streptomyces sp. NBC_00932]MCX4726743.1 gas vesicle protein [Streptomyces sp. NBC_01306]